MRFPSRAWRLSLLPLLLCAQVPDAIAQSVAAPPATGERFIASRAAWLYRGSDITPDPAWHFGTLTNGLRYAIRHNGVPPGQVSVRVRIDAGSLMERDTERGFAHLIEHLSFRGSAFVPDGEARRIWQRMGTTFGSDTNAQTTTTQTVYKLDLPSATPANLAESLHILSGMVSAPNINHQALTGELPAVLAEQREAPGPQVRLSDQLNAVLFAGQPLADRSPIGHVATLLAATPATVQTFHDRWYRPERALVVVSGDVDPAAVEQLLAQNFGPWQGTGTAPPEVDLGSPEANHPSSGSLVETGLPILVQTAVLRPWHFNNDTVLFNQDRLVDQTALDVINRRLEERARDGGSYLSAQVSLDDVARSANVTSVQVLPIGDDWQSALRDVRAVIANAQASPPTQAEIDRELAERGAAFRAQVEQSRAAPGSSLADDMVQAIDIRETTTAPATILAVFDDARTKHMFTPARVFASTRRIFQGVDRAVINTHAPAANIAGELATAMTADVSHVAVHRDTGPAIGFDRLPRLGRPATVVARQNIAGLPDLIQADLSNGVRVMLYQTQSEDNRVYVRVRFGGGYNVLPTDRATPAWAADLALVAGGIGRLRQGDLDRMTQGRRLGLDFTIEQDAFSLAALVSPTDLNDELRLIAAYLHSPGWDPAPVARAKNAMLLSYSGYDASPDGVLSRDLPQLLRAGDPRWHVPTPDEVRALTPLQFRQFWEPLVASGPIEVQVFGDIQIDAALTTVRNTLGALPPRPAIAAAVPALPFPDHVAQPVARTHGGQDNQAVAVIAWPTGGGTADVRESRRLDVLAAIFTDRLFDRLRGEAGASYSPNVSSDWPISNPDGGRLVATGRVAPENLALFFRLSREIAADLAAHPVSPDELQRQQLPMLEAIRRQSTGNQFWMIRLAGATYDPARVDALRSVYNDVATLTAADLQQTAQRYLRPDADWTMQVLPRAPTSGASPAVTAPAPVPAPLPAPATPTPGAN